VVAICDTDIGRVTELIYHRANGEYFCLISTRRVLWWVAIPPLPKEAV
jgi:hypothetical protein